MSGDSGEDEEDIVEEVLGPQDQETEDTVDEDLGEGLEDTRREPVEHDEGENYGEGEVENDNGSIRTGDEDLGDPSSPRDSIIETLDEWREKYMYRPFRELSGLRDTLDNYQEEYVPSREEIRESLSLPDTEDSEDDLSLPGTEQSRRKALKYGGSAIAGGSIVFLLTRDGEEAQTGAGEGANGGSPFVNTTEEENIIQPGETYGFEDIEKCLSEDQKKDIEEEVGDPSEFEYRITTGKDYDIDILKDGEIKAYLDNETLHCPEAR